MRSPVKSAEANRNYTKARERVGDRPGVYKTSMVRMCKLTNSRMYRSIENDAEMCRAERLSEWFSKNWCYEKPCYAKVSVDHQKRNRRAYQSRQV